MQLKHEWRKQEKGIYLPKNKPELLEVPSFNFISITGEGSPDEPIFSDKVGALYALAYTIKMGLKKLAKPPQGYLDYTVYPLEGVWDINEQARTNFNGTVNKQDFVYKLMIRQPDFVEQSLFEEMLAVAMSKKQNPLLKQIRFEQFSEGLCVQMLHLGPFSEEPASFEQMEIFAKEQGVTRLSKIHREIYLSDMRRVAPEKLKTVLRFHVKR